MRGSTSKRFSTCNTKTVLNFNTGTLVHLPPARAPCGSKGSNGSKRVKRVKRISEALARVGLVQDLEEIDVAGPHPAKSEVIRAI